MGDFDLKILNKKFEGRFREIKGYKVDRYIVRACFFLFIASMFLVAYLHNFDLDYYKCETEERVLDDLDTSFISIESQNFHSGCENPFYKPPTWKNEEILQTGEYGLKPSKWVKWIYFSFFVIFLIGILVNHLIHNKKVEEGK